MKIDFTYIINLNTPNTRINEKIGDIKFPYNVNYYITSAINGWDVIKFPSKSPYNFKLADWWKTTEYGDKNFYNRDVTPGEAGCMLSHYDCIYSGYRDGFKNILILEEDFYSLGKFPTQEEMDSIPVDASIIYLDRSQLWGDDKEKRINKHITEVGYTYNNHAYIVTRKGMKEIIESSILDNIIVSDEFFPAINGTSDRLDAVKIFNNPEFKAYALNGGYIGQTSNPNINSLTEFTPEDINKQKMDLDIKTPWLQKPINLPPKTNLLPILDVEDWNLWSKKYIHPLILSKEYDLIVDEFAPHVYTFPFFTERFCSELITLSETIPWVNDRHEFYPTTDNLLKSLGMEEIYNKVINDYVRPLAINRFQLDGKSWEHLRDESFIIRYKPEEQAHLGIHHDHGTITTLVNLNPGQFEGGGTYFPKFKYLANPKEIGAMTLHPSNITHKHGARPVTKGTRYVVVSFCKNKDMI
jgi:GR25 family glycosyltransferase involved in LPS biosynthesis